MTTTDQHRDALRASGLSDEQIDAALALMTTDGASGDGLPLYAPGLPGVGYDPARVADLEREVGLAPKWTCETSPGAFLMSLNGFDEIAIAKHFGARIADLRDDPISGGRALAFVHMRRTGLADAAAFDACMTLTMQAVVDYFAPEPKADASAEGNAQ